MSLSGRIGEHYEIAALLGTGAMGEVYRAVDRKMFDRTVAIKFLSERLTDSAEGRARFQREVQTSARLHHPNIVTIYDWGEHLGRDYFVMEFVDGRDLQSFIKGGMPWDLEQRLDVAFQLADALGFAHRAGVIHRDVKPSNVMVDASDTGLRVKLVDFGIAHVERSNLTQTQSQPGTYSYMSPEQLAGASDLDARSDLFSLGIVLCELFSGHHPFEGKSDAMVANRILSDRPSLPGRHGTALPPELEAAILRMLEKDPAARPATAREVAESLREIGRKAVARSVGTDPTFTGLDDLERALVENVVTWARQKEVDGAFGDALAAYEKASRLAPESDRIQKKIAELKHRVAKQRDLDAAVREVEAHLAANRLAQANDALRRAFEIGGHDARLARIESAIAELAAATPEAREREEYIAPRMREIDEALDAGKIDDALTVVSQILRKYPDHGDASLMLDRLVRVASEGISYGDYRSAVREASAAMKAGNLAGASAAAERARAIWPDGPEIHVLASELDAARRESARRVEENEAALRRENEEALRRQHEVLERMVEGARSLLKDARAVDTATPAGVRRGIAAMGKVVKALDLVLADRPDQPGARQLREQVLAEIDELRERPERPQPMSEAPTLEQPEPRVKAKPAARHAPEPRPAAAPIRASRGWIPAVLALTVGLIALGVYVSQRATPDPWATRVDEVLQLPEDSGPSVEEKIKRIRAVYVLLPEADRRRPALAAQEERLGILDEMHRLIDRLDGEVSAASRDASRAGGVAGVADSLSALFSGYRSKLAADDHTANELDQRWKGLLSRISR